jgi:hypothetical protein
VPVPSVINQADTLREIPCLIADDAADKGQVRSGHLTVPVPKGIVQRPDVNAVNVIERWRVVSTRPPRTWPAGRCPPGPPLFQAIPRGGMAGIAVNALFPQAKPTTRPGAVGQPLAPVTSAQ